MRTTYQKLTYLLVCCMLFSCKSLQRISARDTSTQKPVTAKTKRSNRLVFIDDIAIAGGESSHTEEPHGNRTSKKKQKSQTVYAPPANITLTNSNIEKATGLQFKYAILLDALVERLTNIPLLQNMDHWWGTRYCLGGSTLTCIDCSAFTQNIMRDVYKTNIPRTARAQYDNSVRVLSENLQEGDLVFFQTVGTDISHVGIYLTNNKFVHAATSNGVMISDLNDAYWKSRYKGAGRVIKDAQIASLGK